MLVATVDFLFVDDVMLLIMPKAHNGFLHGSIIYRIMLVVYPSHSISLVMAYVSFRAIKLSVLTL